MPRQLKSGNKLLNKVKQWWSVNVAVPRDYSDETTDVLECAKWSNDQVGNITGKRPYGDAWTRSNNPSTTVFTGYKNLEKPESFDVPSYNNYVWSAADSLKKYIDPSVLKEGDMVGLYYSASPNKKKAFGNGSGKEVQTHTGHIILVNDEPYVEHNIHGDIVRNKLNDVLGGAKAYGAVSIIRMK